MDIGSLTGRIELEDKLTHTLQLGIHQIKNFTNSFDGLAGAVLVGAGAVTAAIAGVTTAVIGLGVKGSTILGVEDAFNRLAEAAGSTGEAMASALDRGVRGTVDSMELMQATTRLLSSGMKVSAADMELMAKTAREVGKATGTDAASGLNILSNAMLTGNARALKRYGIQLDLVKAEKQFRAAHEGTTAALSASGKLEVNRIAVLEGMRVKLEKLGESELSFKERIQQVTVSIGNWFDSLAKAVASSPHVIGAFDSISTALKDAFGGSSQTLLEWVVKWINRFADFAGRYGPMIISWMVSIKDRIVDIWHTVQQAWDLVPDWFKKIAKEAAMAGGAVYLTHKALGAIGAGGSGILETVASFATITSGLRDFSSVAISVVPKAIIQMKGLYSALSVFYLFGSMAGGGVLGGIGAVLSGIGTALAGIVATPLFALAAGITAVYGAFKIGQMEAVQDWFEALELYAEGMTMAEAKAAVAQHRMFDRATEAAKRFAAFRKEIEGEARALGRGTSSGATDDKPDTFFSGPKVQDDYQKQVTALDELAKSLSVAERHHVSLADKVDLFGAAASRASEDARRWGIKVKASVKEVADAFDSKELKQGISSVTAEINKVSFAIDDFAKVADTELKQAMFDIVGEINSVQQRVQGAVLAGAANQASDEIAEMTARWEEQDEASKRAGNTGREALEGLSRAFSELSQISQGAFSGIAQGLSTLISSLSAARDAVSSLKQGLDNWHGFDFKSGKMWSSLLDMSSGIMGLVSAAMMAGKALANLFDRNKGRDVIVNFATEHGGFDALHNELLKLGSEGEQLWINLTQGVGRNNPEQARQAVEAVKKALGGLASMPTMAEQAASAGFITTADLQAAANQAVKLWEYIRDSGLYSAETVQAAWERAQDALVAAGDEGAIAARKQREALQELEDKLKSLYDSIANEMPEPEIGVVEQQARAQIAALEAERDAAQEAIDATAASAAESAEEAARVIDETLAAHDFVATLRFNLELPEEIIVPARAVEPSYYAGGGTVVAWEPRGSDTVPAMLTPGERVEPRGAADEDRTQTVIVKIGERVIARTAVRGMPRELYVQGVQ